MLRILKSFCFVTSCFSLNALAFPETPALMTMSEDLADHYLGVVVAKEVVCKKTEDEAQWRATPVWYAQKGNGLFVKDRMIGFHLQKGSLVELGPYIEYKLGCEFQLDQNGQVTVEEKDRMLLGGFLNFDPYIDWRISGKLGYSDKRKHPLNFSLSIRKKNRVNAHTSYSLGLAYRYQRSAQYVQEMTINHIPHTEILYSSPFKSTLMEEEFVHRALDFNFHFVHEINSNWIVNLGARFNKNFTDTPNVASEIPKWEFSTGLLWRF